jgi:ubiquinone/menaquinone biosynthesis C-methylase UbiE
MQMKTQMEEEKLLSHGKDFSAYDDEYNKLAARIKEKGQDVEQCLDILKQLSEFGVGRFFILNRGIDGYWTHASIENFGKPAENYTPLEYYMYSRAPGAVANYERFKNFQRITQENLKSGMILTSVPCGLMDDLLSLGYSGIKDFKLVAIDLDQDSLNQAREQARQLNMEQNCEFIKQNAWEINASEEYDFITSSGLNSYEPDDEKVEELYRVFYKALKPGGKILTSSLSPPPGIVPDSEWLMSEINMQDLMMQKRVFGDVLGITGNPKLYRSSGTTKRQLEKAGFRNIEIRFDPAHMYPALLGVK